MLAVGLVQQVVEARTELEVLVQPVGAVDRQQAEAGALVEALAEHCALVLCDPTLRGDHAPEASGAPVVSLVGQDQKHLQWRNTSERASGGEEGGRYGKSPCVAYLL